MISSEYVDRFHNDDFFKDILLDSKSQQELLSYSDFSELKKTSFIVESILNSKNKAYLISDDENNNLSNFLEKLNNVINNLINEVKLKVVKALDLKKYNYSENESAIDSSFYKYVEQLENQKNVDILINYVHKTLLIHSKDWELIGEIWQSTYDDWSFTTENHLYNVVEKKYRWQWWWKILYELYIELSKIDSDFILPDKDYTNVVSMVELYKKFWFKVVWKVAYWYDYELSPSNYLEMEIIKKNYKSWLKEVRLDYSIIVSKN